MHFHLSIFVHDIPSMDRKRLTQQVWLVQTLHLPKKWIAFISSMVSSWEITSELLTFSSSEVFLYAYCLGPYYVAVVQSLSHVWLFVILWTVACQAPLSSTVSWSLLTLMSMDQWCYLTISSSTGPLLLPSVLSSIWVFSNELAHCIRYWSSSFSISPSSEYSGLISVRINWFDLLAVQRTLKNLHHCHSLKASVLQHSAFFMVQLSLPYYWKNHRFDYMELCWQNDVSTFEYPL